MQNLPLAEQKSATRQSIRQELSQLGNAEKHLASLSIVRQLFDWIVQNPGLKTIAIYAALPNEPQLEQLHQLAEGIDFVYPLSQDDGRMQFYKVSEISELTLGMFNIPEPNPNLHPAIEHASIDAFICPGVAFTSNGRRLGKGGGYYDRILENRKENAQIIGVAFQCQLIDDLPAEAHDIQMDAVISA